MIHELKPPDTHRARRLFAPLSFHVSCAAVLDGVNPGRVLVDTPLNPTAGFVLSPEAAYLSGNAENEDFCASLEAFLRNRDNLGVAMWHLIVVVSSHRWSERLSEIAGDSGITHYARRHYLCDSGDDLRILLPPKGAVLKQIDESFLASNGYTKPEHMERWIRNNWRSDVHFLKAGFGVATVCGAEVVSWSVADCVSDRMCEIGIHTAPDWRRKGIGAFTANGAIQHAFSIGMKSAGWHCHEENIASWRTAEKAGFTLERKYEEYRICQPAEDGDAPHL